MSRCYVCNASQHDGCQAVGGEFAECPRPLPRATVLRAECVYPHCPPHCNNCPDDREYNAGQAADLKREEMK